MFGEIISAGIGLAIGILIGVMVSPLLLETHESSVLQEHMAVPEWQTVEAWGAGYAQGFGDSVAMCRQALYKQREKMLEHMEPLAPGWDSTEALGVGTDRHGVAFPRLGSPTLP